MLYQYTLTAQEKYSRTSNFKPYLTAYRLNGNDLLGKN